jgi:hypothetical protein
MSDNKDIPAQNNTKFTVNKITDGAGIHINQFVCTETERKFLDRVREKGRVGMWNHTIVGIDLHDHTFIAQVDFPKINLKELVQ